VDEIEFQVDGSGEFLFEPDAPVDGAGLAKRAAVVSERGLVRGAGGGDSIGSVVGVVANAGQRAFQVFQLGVLVIDADAGADFGFLGRTPRNSEPRREQRATNDLVPIEAQAGFEEQAISRRPAVLKINAGLNVVTREGRE